MQRTTTAQILGQTVTIHIYLHIENEEPLYDASQHDVADYRNKINQSNRLNWCFEYQNGKQPEFTINGITYKNLRGEAYARLNDNVMTVDGRRQGQFSDSMSDAAKTKIKAEILPHLLPYLENMAEVRAMTWKDTLQRIQDAAAKHRKQADDLTKYVELYQHPTQQYQTATVQLPEDYAEETKAEIRKSNTIRYPHIIEGATVEIKVPIDNPYWSESKDGKMYPTNYLQFRDDATQA